MYTISNILRSAIDEAKVKVVLFLLVVHIETSGNLVSEVAVDIAGVVEDLDLPHSGDTQQHVLIVDEGLVPSVQGLIVVPFSPVEATQQWALSILFQVCGQWTVRHWQGSLGVSMVNIGDVNAQGKLTVQKSVMLLME